MPKYIIEGSINFFEELYKSLDEEEDQHKSEKDENICLISKQPLMENFVAMKCGHKFNYIPLFKDLYNHKKNFNNLESSSGKLDKNEIRCPYCRMKQTELLPYYENIGVQKVMGINDIYVEPNKTNQLSFLHDKCEYVENSSNGENNTPILCYYYGTPICLVGNGTNYGDTKRYCWKHKKMMIRKYKQELLEKEKQAKLDEKLKAKKLKEEAKLLEKEEKKKSKLLQKELKQKNKIQNVVLGPSIVQQEEEKQQVGCIALLKTGVNKGKPCGRNICNLEHKTCKRHTADCENAQKDVV